MIIPDEVLQASIVHALLSSMLTAICVIDPVDVLQASVVQALPSSMVTSV